MNTSATGYFDLHCDALYKCRLKGYLLTQKDLETNLSFAKSQTAWCQAFAVFVPDRAKKQPLRYFKEEVRWLKKSLQQCSECISLYSFREPPKPKVCNAFLTVENASCLEGNIENLEYLHKQGVKMITLTWNGENHLGYGWPQNKGLKPFGHRVVKEMNKRNMVIDVSHLSRKGFEDVAVLSSRPFVASHSNSYTVCPHGRNLTDTQFQCICKKGGLVGMNFNLPFLKENAHEQEGISLLLKHIEHFLSLGGENTLAIGSDFDGAHMPQDLKNVFDIDKLIAGMLQLNYSESLVKKILFGNAFSFFQNTFVRDCKTV